MADEAEACFLRAKDLIGFISKPDKEDSFEKLRELSVRLDAMIATASAVDEPFVDWDEEAPSPDYSDMRETINAAFPELGYYPVCDPLDKIKKAKAMVGDAIDDLADIYRDLGKFLWLWENVGHQQACWQVKFLFHAHWGRHAINLRSYLHAQLHEA